MQKRLTSNKRATATCEICGEVIETASPLILFSHLLQYHPLELAETPQAQNLIKAISRETEKLGLGFANFLRGKFQ